jgi:hypothetical protein
MSTPRDNLWALAGLPRSLEHDNCLEEVHAYAAKTVPNAFNKDELTLAQAKKLGSAEWPLWLETVGKELSSLIIENEAFDVLEYEDVPNEKRNKIYNLLVLLRRKRDQHQEITKYKARMVMDGSTVQIGVNVFNTYASVIDSAVRLLTSLAFDNHWEMFH